MADTETHSELPTSSDQLSYEELEYEELDTMLDKLPKVVAGIKEIDSSIYGRRSYRSFFNAYKNELDRVRSNSKSDYKVEELERRAETYKAEYDRLTKKLKPIVTDERLKELLKEYDDKKSFLTKVINRYNYHMAKELSAHLIRLEKRIENHALSLFGYGFFSRIIRNFIIWFTTP